MSFFKSKDGTIRPGKVMLRWYFARRIVNPWHRPSIMRRHIYTGVMGAIWGALIGDIIFVYFGTTVGITEFRWGIMAGLSSWIVATQIFGARLTDRTGKRKLIWFVCAAGDRLLRYIGILIAYWFYIHGWAHADIIVIVTVCVANFFGTMAAPPWLSWLADIIPENEQGSFWGRRSAWIALSVVVVILSAGYLADRAGPEHKMDAALIIFTFATVIGLLDILIHGTIPEPKMILPQRKNFWRHTIDPIKDKRFRPWLMFNLFWTFSMTLGGALATLYFMQDLELKKNFLGGMLALPSLTLIGSLLTGKWSGRLVDKYGTRKVLFWGHIFWSTLPLFWLFASPLTVVSLVGASSLVGGIAVTAASNAATKLITRLPSAENRAMYIAVSTTIGSLAAGLGVMTAGTALKFMKGWSMPVGSWSLGSFQILFIISTLLRLGFTLFFVPRLREPGEPSEENAIAGIHRSATVNA